jgi:hypothetical protein
LVVSVAVVLSRRAARALSARSDSRVDGIPMRVLSIGETFRLLRGMAPLVVVSVPVVVVLAFGGVVVVAELSVCWLCVGVGAGAPVPICVESLLGVAVVEGDVVVVLLDDESVVVDDDGAGAGVVVVVPIDESVVVVVEEDGVVVVEDDGVVIDEESVVVEVDGVVVVVVVDDGDDGDDVTSPVDVACEPSFDTRMCVLVWPSTTAGERAIAAIAMSLIFMSSP